MDYKSVFGLGNRVEIRVSQLAERAKNTGEKVNCYISSIYEVYDDKILELEMPTEKGKVILFPVSVRLDLVVVTRNGMYGCTVLVKDRYKKDNRFMLKVQILSDIVKVQRREYYRLECTMDMTYFKITKEQAALPSIEKVIEDIETEEDYYLNEAVGLILDISGGGIRFRSGEGLEKDSYILIHIPVSIDENLVELQLLGHVIASSPVPIDPDKHEHRIQFEFKDPTVQEYIVRYIFEEERHRRKRENGT